MITVIASIQIKEGRVSEFIELFKANATKVLEEKGCMEYVATIDVPTGLPPQELNENGVTVIEKYDSIEALQAHSSAPHMLAFMEKVGGIVDGMSIKVLKEA